MMQIGFAKPCQTGAQGRASQVRKSRKMIVRYDKRRYKRRKGIEHLFGWLKNWRSVATRYSRCLKVFLLAIALAETVIY
jgi:transposase